MPEDHFVLCLLVGMQNSSKKIVRMKSDGFLGGCFLPIDFRLYNLPIFDLDSISENFAVYLSTISTSSQTPRREAIFSRSLFLSFVL